jgi:hydroxymethylpyrimidine/phosphomethylpyrimidine kinase
MTAITAITAQNTVGVEAVELVSPEMVLDQIATVGGDIRIDAIKIGMLGSAETVESVFIGLLLAYVNAPVVIDPVMVAESGAILLDDDTRAALVERLFPKAAVVTPNIPEARVLTGMGDSATQEELARGVLELGPKAAVVTGGHSSEIVDIFFDGEQLVEIPGERHPNGAAHGSGCTHSSSLAAYLALGWSPLAAAVGAREIASEAVGDGLRRIGSGPGPVDVFALSRTRSDAEVTR